MVLHRGTGRFGVKSVVKNANEILQGALLGLEAAWGIGERSFNMGGESRHARYEW